MRERSFTAVLLVLLALVLLVLTPVIAAETTLTVTGPIVTQATTTAPLASAASPVSAAALNGNYITSAPGWHPKGFDNDVLKEPQFAPSSVNPTLLKYGKYFYDPITGEWLIPLTRFEGGLLTPLNSNATNQFFDNVKFTLSYRAWTAPDNLLILGGRSIFITGAIGTAGSWGAGLDTTYKKTNVDDDGRWRIGGLYIDDGNGNREIQLITRYSMPALDNLAGLLKF